jgi:DNA polymerase III delta prime subunit
MIDNNDFNAILDKYIRDDKINHAYLIETNSDNRLNLAYLLINKILKLKNNNITIDDLYINNDLIKVSTDTATIKKEDIISLKDKLKTKSLFTGKRIYIIEEAEKLNSSSANTLLKFLEEPDDGIIAILITKNKYQIIDTILSRCQEIRYYEKEEITKELKYADNIIKFISTLDKEKEKTIAFTNKYFDKEVFERNNFQNLLEEMLLIYYDILQKKAKLDITYCKNFEQEIKKLSEENNFEELNLKILSVNSAIEKLKVNANTKLVLDSLIIESIGGIPNV